MLYWCSKCQTGIPGKIRQQRQQTKGWVCPICGTGLPTRGMKIIEEEEDLQERLLQALRE